MMWTGPITCISILIRVDDSDKLIAAAKQRAIATGVDGEFIVGDTDAIHMLFDLGESPDGCSIMACDVEASE